MHISILTKNGSMSHFYFIFLKITLMTVCPSSLHSCVQGTNFPPPSEPPGEIMSFGVSPVNYSDSDSDLIATCIIFTCRKKNDIFIKKVGSYGQFYMGHSNIKCRLFYAQKFILGGISNTLISSVKITSW